MTGGQATWLYAVVPAAPPGGFAGVTGVAGEPVRVVATARLAAVVGSVPLDDFGRDALTAHLEDLRWLEAAARAHHRVIAAAARAGDVVPFRFASIYHDDARVLALLEERHTELADALRGVAGSTEWGVKAFVDQPGGERPGPRAPAAGGGRPGTAYLLRRKAQREEQDTAHQRALDRAEEIHGALARLARGSARHRPQDPRLAAYRGWMVLNASYLVADTRTGEFADAVAALRERFPDVRLELVGPWPPYSFAAGEREETAGPGVGTGAGEGRP
ncbi:GvpL/GvpF family gas vesicle protein [Streptomyces capparidis]